MTTGWRARRRTSCPSTRATARRRRQPRRTPAATRPPTSGRRSGSATACSTSSRASSTCRSRRRRSAGKKVKNETMIFPRYHQLDAVRKLVADARARRRRAQLPGPALGRQRQEQHHRLAGPPARVSLHDADDQKVFDSVIVVTDRARARPAAPGHDLPVRAQAGRGAEDRRELDAARRGARDAATPIIITTLQKFPFVTEKIGDAAGARRYAVIVDEAHSSQTGETRDGAEGGARPASAIAEEAARQRPRTKASTDYEEEILRSDGQARPAAEPQLLRLHRHAEAQDAGGLRPTGRGRQAAAVPPLPHAPGHRGGLHPRRARRTTRPTRPTTG